MKTTPPIGHCLSSNTPITFDTSGSDGQRVFVTAMSGAGKTVLMRTLLESCVSPDNPYRVPVIVIDKDGSYTCLKTTFPDRFVLIGGDRADRSIDVGIAAAAAELAVTCGVSMVLDISTLNPEEGQEVVCAVCDALMAPMSEPRRPVLLLIDEVQNFAGESMKGAPSRRTLDQVAAECRKHGIHFVAATQRPSSVSKTILTQANVRIVGRMSGDTDLVRIGRELGLAANEIKKIPSLPTHSFYVVGSAMCERATIMETVMPASLPPQPAGPDQFGDPLSVEDAIARLRGAEPAPARTAHAVDAGTVILVSNGEGVGDVDDIADLLAGERDGKLHRDQLAVLLGWSTRGRRLKYALAAGEARKVLRVTKAGYVTASHKGAGREGLSAAERFAMVRTRLSQRSDRILAVVAATAEGVERSELAGELGLARISAATNDALDDLRKRGLIVRRHGRFKMPPQIARLMRR